MVYLHLKSVNVVWYFLCESQLYFHLVIHYSQFSLCQHSQYEQTKILAPKLNLLINIRYARAPISRTWTSLMYISHKLHTDNPLPSCTTVQMHNTMFLEEEKNTFTLQSQYLSTTHETTKRIRIECCAAGNISNCVVPQDERSPSFWSEDKSGTKRAHRSPTGETPTAKRQV